jgi:dipeptidyl aminopeptidase/acylaminoacyl peptidase
MWGYSMGGYLTLRAMVISDDVKVGVIWAGVVASYPDLLYNWRRTGSFTPSPSSRGVGWRTSWIEQYGTPEQNPVFWDSVSATSYLADLSGPLELHHGTADEDSPLSSLFGWRSWHVNKGRLRISIRMMAITTISQNTSPKPWEKRSSSLIFI